MELSVYQECVNSSSVSQSQPMFHLPAFFACLQQAAHTNGFTQHATPEQLDCLHALRDSMLSNQGSQKGPSGWQAQGLTREQLSEAAQYLLTNLERVLHSQLITLREVSSHLRQVGKMCDAT